MCQFSAPTDNFTSTSRSLPLKNAENSIATSRAELKFLKLQLLSNLMDILKDHAYLVTDTAWSSFSSKILIFTYLITICQTLRPGRVLFFLCTFNCIFSCVNAFIYTGL